MTRPNRPDQLDNALAALVPGYLQARRDDVETLRELLARGDLESIRLLGHRLKGSGRTYGFAEISALGLALELAARQGDRAAVAGAVERLEAFLETLDGG